MVLNILLITTVVFLLLFGEYIADRISRKGDPS